MSAIIYHAEHSISMSIDLLVKSKDIYVSRPVLEAETLIYDSTGNGKPLIIPVHVLQNAKYGSEKIPLIFGHRNKHLEVGYLDNFHVDKGVLYADIHVYPRWNTWVLRKFADGHNGISLEFEALEKDEGDKYRVIALTIDYAAIVPRPASHRARVY